MNLLIEKNVPLAQLTTLKIGGAAKLFVRITSENQIAEVINFAEKNRLKIFILGGGSNVLIADEGFDGLVLQIALRGISVEQSEDKVLVTAKAGEDWDAFCAFCVDENLQGVECLSGIPGLIGGTPVQNVGAYGQDVSETIQRVRVFDRLEKKFSDLSNADCEFGYRKSIFNSSQKNRYIVTSVVFALKENGQPKIVYKDLLEIFDTETPTLRQTREAVLKIRRAKSMVIGENDPNSKSAGSFFKNPVVSKAEFGEIEKRAKIAGIENVPFFKNGENVKIPAAWLIEKSDFYKGFNNGKVGLSTNHTLAIINLDDASAYDILKFKDEIQAKVKTIFAVELQPEPIFVGF
ncbi:MAG: UDP-N-acetylmuramate dehydrogenase [Acidobacteriota bacterium]|nr:UDP-N-acetylmuramate dehydrogenase [Acidobacteriota bacterium]